MTGTEVLTRIQEAVQEAEANGLAQTAKAFEVLYAKFEVALEAVAPELDAPTNFTQFRASRRSR